MRIETSKRQCGESSPLLASRRSCHSANQSFSHRTPFSVLLHRQRRINENKHLERFRKDTKRLSTLQTWLCLLNMEVRTKSSSHMRPSAGATYSETSSPHTTTFYQQCKTNNHFDVSSIQNMGSPLNSHRRLRCLRQNPNTTRDTNLLRATPSLPSSRPESQRHLPIIASTASR